jgi:hypothetical protein
MKTTKTTKKVTFVSAGYYHTDQRFMYRYADAEGKMYDLYDDEVYRWIHPEGDDSDYAYVDPKFLDIFVLREVGDYNYLTKRWDWVYD